MKFNALLILLLAFVGQPLIAQTKLSREEFNTLICFRWKLTEASFDGMKIPASEIGENIMEHSSNGTFTVKEQGESYSGKWAFDPATQELLTDDRDGKEKHKVIRLTQDELVTEIRDANGTFRMKFKRLQ